MAREDEAARRLATSPVSGPSTRRRWLRQSATRAASDVARPGCLARAGADRQRQGAKPKLLGITKRGSRYLRENLIHGARAVLPRFAAPGNAAW